MEMSGNANKKSTLRSILAAGAIAAAALAGAGASAQQIVAPPQTLDGLAQLTGLLVQYYGTAAYAPMLNDEAARIQALGPQGGQVASQTLGNIQAGNPAAAGTVQAVANDINQIESRYAGPQVVYQTAPVYQPAPVIGGAILFEDILLEENRARERREREEEMWRRERHEQWEIEQHQREMREREEREHREFEARRQAAQQQHAEQPRVEQQRFEQPRFEQHQQAAPVGNPFLERHEAPAAAPSAPAHQAAPQPAPQNGSCDPKKDPHCHH